MKDNFELLACLKMAAGLPCDPRHRKTLIQAADVIAELQDQNEKVVEALRNTQELLDNLQEHACACNFFISEDHKCGVCKSADDNRTLLAQLQAGKGGE